MNRPRPVLARALCFALALGSSIASSPLAHAAPRTPAQKAAFEASLKLLRDADTLQEKKRFAEAVPLAEKALAMRLRELGPDDVDTLSVTGFLADLYQHNGEAKKAVPLREKLVAAAEKKKGSDRDASVQFATESLAAACSRAGDDARAVKLYEQALAMRQKRVTEPEDLMVGLWLLGNAQARNNDPDTAEATLARAVALVDKGGDAHFREMLSAAGVHIDLGNLYRRHGKYAKARVELERAVELREMARGASDGLVADTLLDLGPVYAEMGDFGRAEAALSRAAKIIEAEAGPDTPYVAEADFALASVVDDRGDYARAEPLFRVALEIREKKLPAGDPAIAASRVGLGRALLHKGALAQAELLLNDGLAALDKAGDRHIGEVARALAALAEIHRRHGDYARAERELGRVVRIHERKSGTASPRAAADRRALAELAESKGDTKLAQKLFEESNAIAEKALGREHPTIAWGLLSLADLQRRAGRRAEAEAHYRRALGIFEKALGPDHPAVAEALEGLADLAVAGGNADAALQDETRADDVLEANVALVVASGSEAEKRAFLASLLTSTDFTISLHAETAPQSTAAMRLALTTILERKGRVLDAMADALASVRRRLDKDDKDLLAELGEARARLSAAVLRGPGDMPVDEYRKETSALGVAAQKLEEKLSSRSASFRSEETPATIERVQAAMPDDAVLVEYIVHRPRRSGATWGAPRYVAYTLTPAGKVAFADLGEAEPIDKAALALRKALSSPDRSDTKALARDLDERVFRPVRALLGHATRLFISPDGALNVVPFAALVDENGKLQLESYELTYLTSGRDLLRMQFHSRPRSGAFVVANPAFGRLASRSEEPAAAQRSMDLGRAVFDALPGTASEGRAVSASLPGSTLLVDTEATESALKKVTGPRILHVATHGFFLAGQTLAPPLSRGLVLEEVATPPSPKPSKAGSPSGSFPAEPAAYENPLLRSGLALAGANARKSGDEDGILTALEAAGLDLDGTKLVVLSACETGLGELQNGDGVYGLRRAFVLAGAETEVTSLWKVADAETRDLMVHYYGKLQAGGGRSAALRDVQRAMLATPATAHPYFWASFVVSGDPSPLGADAPPAEVTVAPAPAPAPAPPPTAKVAPGPRGCACEVGAGAQSPTGDLALGFAGAATFLAIARRRRPSSR